MEEKEEERLVLPLAVAARQLGVTRQTLSYYRHLGELTVINTGRILLVDPTVVKQELEQAGYYRRNNRNRRQKTREKP